MTGPILVADIGGTNVRFGLGTEPQKPVEKILKYQISTFPNPETAVRKYFDDLGLSEGEIGGIKKACFAAAGPVEDDVVSLTNGSWLIDKAQIARLFDLDFLLINDFSGLANAIPYLPETELLKLGSGEPVAGSPKAIFGPGTGLGVSGAVPDRAGGWIVLSGEGGHVAFAPRREIEDRILQILRRRIPGGRVSAERLLCGSGLEMLFEALAEIEQIAVLPQSAKEIVETGMADEASLQRQTISLFCGLLGKFGGDLALTLGSRGGVYLAGGVALALRAFLPDSAFRTRFEDKGRMQKFNADIPTYLLIGDTPALTGCVAAASYT
ncbi:glucokinase [Alphaproteobacteria bacterium]|jgi:glucokinase|nr:glucokinase [Alphaproteobacteria bacterium]